MQKHIRKSIPSTLVFIFCLLISSSFSGCFGCKKKGDSRAIVLFHGLNNPGGLKNLQDKLAKDFPGYKVVALDRENSKTEHIKQQAQEAFEALKKQDLINRELVMFGHSQGGLVAFSLCNQHPELKIKGIITDRTPWEGAPIANTTQPELKQYMSVLKVFLGNANQLGLNLTPAETNNKVDQLEKELETMRENFAKEENKGGHDLAPGSDFLKDVADKLTTFIIPVYAIAGTKINILEVIANFAKIPALKGLNPSSDANIQTAIEQVQNRIFGPLLLRGSSSDFTAHDGLVPLSSAHATNINKPVTFVALPPVEGLVHFPTADEDENSYKTLVQTIKGLFKYRQPKIKKGKKNKGK